MSGATPPEQSSPVPRNSKLKKLESRITAARNALDWTTLSGLLQQHVADSGRESIGGSYRFSHYTTSYVLARIDILLFGERDGGLPEVLKFVNEILPTANDKVLLCIIASVHWCAGAQVRPVANVMLNTCSCVTFCAGTGAVLAAAEAHGVRLAATQRHRRLQLLCRSLRLETDAAELRCQTLVVLQPGSSRLQSSRCAQHAR